MLEWSAESLFRVFYLGVLAVVLVGQARGSQPAAPTPAQAAQFIQRAERQLLDLMIQADRASWVMNNFITHDTEALAAKAQEALIAATTTLAKEAARFDQTQLSAEQRRKLNLLKNSLAVAALSDPAEQKELAEITSGMEGMYGKGQYCPPADPKRCLDLTQLSRIMAESRNPAELLEAWRGWRTISPPMRPMYERFVTLTREGAKELGYRDLGEMWRSKYDMPPEEFAAEMDRLWAQVRPLYESLHCYVRTQLRKKYGADVVPDGKPIPAHLLGNMWAQSWDNVYPLVAPAGVDPGYDLTKILKDRKVDAREMVRYGERFFTSLGFEPLPETFWQRSLFTKPADREVVCHASAWDIDAQDDLRIKMCIEITGEDFRTIHHELGHNFYQRAYKRLDPLFRNSANDGFHEALGDTIALSITPDYLVKIGLLDQAPAGSADLGDLMRMALDKVAFMPFGLLIDRWRWQVFSGEIQPGDYNQGWWRLREQYQGVSAPVGRSEADFDPGAKYHIPANVPYARYFLAAILEFQFHRALARQAGWTGPLHRFSIYGNAEAGRRLRNMMEMGQSRPWPDALEALTGERKMDATAVLEYFAPLQKWLDEQNQGQTQGW
jgi:peptidyl-dipeptidase A